MARREHLRFAAGAGLAMTAAVEAQYERDCDENEVADEREAAAGDVAVSPCYGNCDGSTVAPVC